jgi:DNA-binding transcriptional LysR family regulator
MQLDQLILFDRIASEKSISKVAEESHLSQPALSQKMRKLEEEMDIKLFERSNRGIELTEAGRMVQKYFHQIISVYDEMQEELGNLKQHSGTVRILASPVVGQYALPCSMHKMSEKFPGYNFTLSSMTSLEVIRKVKEGNGFIGFVVGPVEVDGIFCKKVYSDKVHLICSEKYYAKDQISIEELKAKQLIMLVEKFSYQRLLKKALKRQGEELSSFNVLMNLDSTESVKASVIAGLGFAFLPYMAIKKELYLKQLRMVELPKIEIEYDLYMIHKETDGYGDVPLEIVHYFEEIVEETFC